MGLSNIVGRIKALWKRLSSFLSKRGKSPLEPLIASAAVTAARPAVMGSNRALIAMNKGLVAGVTNNGANGFKRLEIDDFCQNSVRLNLYLLALQAIQNADNLDDRWNWFQVQGIHGAPHTAWDGIGTTFLYAWLLANGHYADASDYSDPANAGRTGVRPTAASQGDSDEGYCTHGSILFPTWHRVYEAMIEQVIQATMMTIANQYPTSHPLYAKSRAAAVKFRQPYWDFCRARTGNMTATKSTLTPGLPLIFAVQSVRVKAPTSPDTWQSIPNPLYAYKFPTAGQYAAKSLSVTGGAYFDLDLSWTTTLRHPPGGAPTGTTADNRALQTDFASSFASLKEALYMTLATDQDYWKFSNNYCTVAQQVNVGDLSQLVVNRNGKLQPSGSAGVFYSLESWHNTMHGVIGGNGGAMSYPVVAAFDPIFIHHHGNVDHIFALWQALWPSAATGKALQYWFDPAHPSAATATTFTNRLGTIETGYDPLLPFRKASALSPASSSPVPAPLDTMWSSDDVKDYSGLGYQYENIPTSMKEDARKKAATREMNIKYAWFAPVATSGVGLGPLPAASSKDKLNPVPMDGVKAFTEWPPIIDGGTSDPLWLPSTASSVSPLLRVKTREAAAKPKPEKVSAEEKSTVAASEPVKPDLSEKEKLSKKETPRDGDEKPASHPLFPRPNSDFAFTFPPSLLADQAANKLRTWHFAFRAERHGIDTAFTLFPFLGDFPADPRSWAAAESLVMPLHNFINHSRAACEAPTDDSGRPTPPDAETGKKGSGCANCDRHATARTLIGGSAPLTTLLIRFIHSGAEVPPREPRPGEPPAVALRSLEPEDVVPFLKRNLHMRIRRSDGAEVPRDQLPGLKVLVYDQLITLPMRVDDMPKVEEPRLQAEVWDGRPGGWNSDEVVVRDW